MENKEFSKKLEARTKAFAIRIIKLSATMKWAETTELESALKESNELLAIFTSIGKNLNL